jgi:hypothetical protein
MAVSNCRCTLVFKCCGLFVLASFLVGCQPQQAKPPAAPPVIKIVEAPPVVQPAPPEAAAGTTPLPMPPTPTEQVKADVGVGIKGRALDEHEGMVVTPVKGLFAAKEMIAFEIMVPQALALYAATEGDYPKSHKEFWDKVIVPNQLESQLPELPEGHRYIYDPVKRELMVERPKGWKFTPKN